MNILAWVQALNGTTLILVIAALLFIEEVGVPLPLAPGDLMLAIAGIAVAAGQVPVLEAVVVTFVAIVAGAITGHTLFSLVGLNRLLRLARVLHLESSVQRVSEILRRGGWRGVFTARLIPGLRVHTTEVAGVIGVTRTTFIAGLLPAAAVYDGAFVGLGAAFGKPILAVIHSVERQALPVGVAVALLVLILILRGWLWRSFSQLARGTWAEAMVLRIESPGVLLVPAAIGLNFIGHALATELQLPLFLDTTGTILAGVLAGPWVGGSVGIVTNLVSANSIDPNAVFYAPVSFAIGFVAGIVRRQGWLSTPSGWIVLWAMCFLISALVSTPLNLLVSDGHSGVPFGDAIVDRLTGRVPLPIASLAGEAAVDLPDKLVAVVVAVLIYRGLPAASAPGRTLEIDLRRALTFVFGSPRWLRRILAASLCIAFVWLAVPYFLIAGYLVETSRRHELPPWERLRTKLKDGALVSVALLAWNIPSLGLTVAGEVGGWDDVVVAGNLVGLLVALLTPAVWAQYLDGGLRAAIDVLAVARRVRANLGLTVVIGALGLALPLLSVAGLVGFVVGVFPVLAYLLVVIAYLYGEYAVSTHPDEVSATPAPVTTGVRLST
jgi:energy-coupling factor transport system substrate-specific component